MSIGKMKIYDNYKLLLTENLKHLKSILIISEILTKIYVIY